MRLYARRQMESEPKIDYFATSLPNFLLFDHDLAVRNPAASFLLMAFAESGLGNAASARALFERVLELDASIFEARHGLNRLDTAGTMKDAADARRV